MDRTIGPVCFNLKFSSEKKGREGGGHKKKRKKEEGKV
jgi:hypothetical protein